MKARVSTRRFSPDHIPTSYKLEGDMKYDTELLRALLLHVEEKAIRVHDNLEDIEIDGWGPEEVAYHVVLAADAGLIRATVDRLPDDEDPEIIHVDYSVHSLTMDGHGLLEALRDPKRLRIIKERASQAGAGTIKLLMRVAEDYVSEQIRKLTGG